MGCVLHKPRCPVSVGRWQCHYRSKVERAVQAGRLDPVKAKAHLAKYGMPITPNLGRVYSGAAAAPSKLFSE